MPLLSEYYTIFLKKTATIEDSFFVIGDQEPVGLSETNEFKKTKKSVIILP